MCAATLDVVRRAHSARRFERGLQVKATISSAITARSEEVGAKPRLVARQLGLSDERYRQIQGGVRAPSLRELVGIAVLLQQNTHQFVEGLPVADYERTTPARPYRTQPLPPPPPLDPGIMSGTTPDAVGKRFGHALRTHRRRFVRRPIDLLAAEAGMTYSGAMGVENGKLAGDLVRLVLLCDACEVSISGLLRLGASPCEVQL